MPSEVPLTLVGRSASLPNMLPLCGGENPFLFDIGLLFWMPDLEKIPL